MQHIEKKVEMRVKTVFQKKKNILWTWDKNKSCCSAESSFTGISSKFLISHQDSLSSTYFVGGPGLPVCPVHVVPDVPPLDLQRVGGRPGPSEGAGHLHVLASVCCHVVRHLGEHGWTQNWEKGYQTVPKWILKKRGRRENHQKSESSSQPVMFTSYWYDN